jgi:hypothetical protein
LQLIQRIYKEFIAPHEASLPAGDEEGFQQVCSEKKRSYFSSEILQIFNADQLNCSLVPVPETSFPTTISFATVKRSPYRRLINYRYGISVQLWIAIMISCK